MKNIDRPVKVWHWHPDSASGSDNPIPSKSTPENKSIAVLPFDNMSGDVEQEYYSDGISEDIITDLSKVTGLLIISRNSSFAYKGKAIDLRTVAQELGVNFILEGSVRRAVNRVRITAQLIDATIGTHLWAERYDGDLTDIFAVQDEVTLKIVSALKIRLTPTEKVSITSTGTTNIEAHDNFLRLRSLLYWPCLTDILWKRAIAYGERAIQLDPDFTQAYAVLAIIHMLDYHNHWSGDEPDQVLLKAAGLAKRAKEIDQNDLLANHAVAVVAHWMGDHDLATLSIEKTLSINPDYALALFTRSEVAIATGRSKEAIPDLERAIRLDPGFAHQYLQFLGMAHLLLGNYETAVLVFRERLMLVKDTDIGRAWLASALGHLGEIAQAQETWSDLLKIKPDFLIEPRIAKLAYVNQADIDTIMEGLAKAGLPY